jgi:SNF2 family DNA or RNA helicase
MHVTAEALSSPAVLEGLGKFLQTKYRIECDHGLRHDFDWWADALLSYRDLLTEADPTLYVRMLAHAEELVDRPIRVRKHDGNYFIIEVPHGKHEWVKEKFFALTGKADLRHGELGKSVWSFHRQHLPALLASGEFLADEDDLTPTQVEAVCDHYEDKAVLVAIERAQMNPNVDPDALGLAHPLRPYQADGIKKIARKLSEGGCLIADEMGLGKSLEALALSIHFDLPGVVIAPASVCYNWVGELFKHTKEKTVHIVFDRGRGTASLFPGNEHRFKPMDKADYLVVSYEGCKKLTLFSQQHGRILNPIYRPLFQGRLCIIDEAHYIKNPGAQRTQNARAAIAGCRRALALTGTPVMNRPEELWEILVAIGRDRDLCKTKGEFEEHYIDNPNLDLHRKLIDGGWFLRRRKEDVEKELPLKQRGELTVQMDNALYRRYVEMRAGLKDDGTTVANQLAIMTHLQTIANEAKVEPLVGFLYDRAQAGTKTVVQCTRTAPIHAIAQKLEAQGVATVILDGGTDRGERRMLQDRFQAGFVPVCLTTLAEGIDLFAADTCVIVDFDWNPAKITQREDRIHRIGQKALHVTILRVIAATIDVHKKNIVARKQEIASTICDGRHIEITNEDLQGQVLAALIAEAKAS